MKELRCFTFTTQEVAAAALRYRRRRQNPIPPGVLYQVRFDVTDTVSTILSVTTDDGGLETVSLPESEMVAMLVSFCIDQKIPLPAESHKSLAVIRDALSLNIRMNFTDYKPARAAATGSSGKERRIH